MTREEARKTIDDILACFGDKSDGAYELTQSDAKDMRKAIQTLSVEPCEDCISRQSVLEPYKPLYDTDTICIRVLRKNIEQAPPVIPKQKIGHWIDDTSLGYHISICSNCDWIGHGDTCLIYKPKYCPNCGAKMKGDIE